MRTKRLVLLLGAGAVVFATAAGVIALRPDASARFFWEKLNLPEAALLTVESDVALAYEIGAAHFNINLAPDARKGRYDPLLAQRAFDTAAAIDPAYPLAHYQSARAAFVLGDFTVALAGLEKELALSPSNQRPRYIRGLVYAYRGLPGDLALAEEDFRAFVAWAPGEWAGYNDLAFVLARQEKYGEAAAAATHGIEMATNGVENAWLWNALGVAQLSLGDKASAEITLEKAQSFAALLSEELWRQAYPGNAPESGADGLASFRAGIDKNLELAKAL